MLSSTMRRISWVLMALVAIGALAYGATDDRGPQSDAERVAALAGTLACPQCSGQPVNDSNAPIAEIIRAEIKQSVDAGMTDAEIRNMFVERYGEWVDLTPSRSGLTGMVWVMPFLVIGAATGTLALAFSRWKGMSRSVVSATDEDRQLVASVLEGASADRGAGAPDAGDGGANTEVS